MTDMGEAYKIKLSEAQQSALEIFILDPIHAEFDPEEEFPGHIQGKTLCVTGDLEKAWRILTDASNANEDDAHLSHSLTTLATKCIRELHRQRSQPQ